MYIKESVSGVSIIKRTCLKRLLILILVVILALAQGQTYNKEEIFIIDDEGIAMSGTIGVTPQMFGAKGDGISNDSKAVQAAIDFASKSENHIMFIPEGVYSVRNLRLKENVILLGEGDKSVLLADPSCQTWNGILYCERLSSVQISNITFDGNKPIVPGNTQEGTVNIWLNFSKNVSISNCVFQNNNFLGICIKSSSNITIENNKFVNLDCGVITSSYPSSDIIIDGNYFDGAEFSEPISIFGLNEGFHENISITNNIIKNHIKGSGILVRAAKSVTISNNIIDNCCTGIYCSSSTYSGKKYGVYDALIENNKITNTICEGILIDGLTNSKVIDNVIENAGSFGFLTRSANENIISHNIITNNDISKLTYDGFAMTLSGLKGSKVSNNSINIEDNQVDSRRKPITISSSSSNNIFNDNTFATSFKELYRTASYSNTIN